MTDCRVALTGGDVALHHRVRHDVFVVEQAVFPVSDLDVRDDDPATIKALARIGGEAAGAVRLYPVDGDGDVWQGDRLAVLPRYRTHLGSRLVRFAVATASAAGGSEMVAHVQVANVRFFERLGWERRGGPELYVGLTHQLMAIGLAGRVAVTTAPSVRVGGRSPVRR